MKSSVWAFGQLRAIRGKNNLSTLIYLINAQDRINEQERNFPKIINQAGWSQQAGRANFEAIINEQGGKD